MNSVPNIGYVPICARQPPDLTAMSYSQLDEGKVYYMNNYGKWYIVRLISRDEWTTVERLYELILQAWKPIPRENADDGFEDIDIGGKYVFYMLKSMKGGGKRRKTMKRKC
jgi:hypothetical protein